MGVKSLWSLLDPVGRPVLYVDQITTSSFCCSRHLDFSLETMEGKAMAIDSSIWIYQFQATMRDKEGRGLVNAHVVGFLRRICKLLFYGIKPVFVFDGGAPALKRSTIVSSTDYTIYEYALINCIVGEEAQEERGSCKSR